MLFLSCDLENGVSVGVLQVVWDKNYCSKNGKDFLLVAGVFLIS